MSGVDDMHDEHGEETWHLRQLWQFAKNRGYSVKLEDDRIWLTPIEQGSAAPGRSFPDSRAGMQAARKWLHESPEQEIVQLAAGHPAVQQHTVQLGLQHRTWGRPRAGF